MSRIIPDVQILDQDDVWQSAITGLMSCQIDGGLSAGASKPGVGRCDLTWDNASQVYNPDPAGSAGSSALLRARRRIRVKVTSADQGDTNILQVQHSGAYGLGGTAVITASGQNLPIGNSGGTDYEQAQSLRLVAGWLNQIVIRHGPSTGAPGGTVTWTLYTDDAGQPGTPLATGAYVPSASADNTITPTGLPVDDVVYWLHLKPTRPQAANSYWTWQASTSDSYADGMNAWTTDGGATWTPQPSVDCQCSIQTVGCCSTFYQVVSRAVGVGETWTLTYDCRAQFDSFACDLYAAIAGDTDWHGVAQAVTNRWATYRVTFTTLNPSTTIKALFYPHFTGNGQNSMALEFRNITLAKSGAANVLVNGDFASGDVAPWARIDISSPTTSANALSVIRDYRILFNGKIKRIEPAPFQRAGQKTCRVIAVDFVDELQRKKVTGLALQKDQRGDQLVRTALALMLPANLKATIPGGDLDIGTQTFSRAFDGYTKGTTLYDLITDCAVSEYGLWWVDPDGTLRWVARDYAPKRIAAGVKLALAGRAASDTTTPGDPFQMMIAQDAAQVINKTVLTWHPRATQLGTVVLGQITSAVRIPPVQADGSPGTRAVTLTFRDPTTQKVCGGDNVIAPVPTLDYLVNDNPAGTGFDYTGNPHFAMEVVSVDASQITVNLKNTAIGSLYAVKFQVRGNAVVTYDPQTISTQDDAAVAADDESAWTKELPFTDDGNFVTALGQYLVDRFKAPFDAVEWVRADWRTTLGGAGGGDGDGDGNGIDVLSVAPMDVLSVSDVQAGLTTPLKHLMVHWSYQFTPQGADAIGMVTWALERVDDAAYAILDDPLYGRLDSGCRLFI